MTESKFREDPISQYRNKFLLKYSNLKYCSVFVLHIITDQSVHGGKGLLPVSSAVCLFLKQKDKLFLTEEYELYPTGIFAKVISSAFLQALKKKKKKKMALKATFLSVT